MKYSGTYACGHEGVIHIYGPTKEHEQKREYVFSQVCPECAKLERQKERDEANKKASDAAIKSGLPELTGTEKQIAWATTIRNDIIGLIDNLAKEHEGCEVQISDGKLIHIEEWQKAFETILKCETTAKFWIENREKYQINAQIIKKCKDMYF